MRLVTDLYLEQFYVVFSSVNRLIAYFNSLDSSGYTLYELLTIHDITYDSEQEKTNNFSKLHKLFRESLYYTLVN